MKILRFVVLLLVVIGALNWGAVSFFGMDVVSNVFGMKVARFIFGLVGLAGVYSIGFLCRCIGCGCKCGSNCNCCKK